MAGYAPEAFPKPIAYASVTLFTFVPVTPESVDL